MPRLLFEKTGNAVWVSHLDLMRVFQRAFKRAGLALTHSKGFSPRPQVAIALPLSVGVESHCELLDFDLDEQTVSEDKLLTDLNQALIPGVRVLKVYDNGMKIRDLALLQCQIILEYDNGVPHGCLDAVDALFHRDSLMVEKKGKNGIQEQDIIPMLRRLELRKADDRTLEIRVMHCCQNPSLNPMQLIAAIGKYIPEYNPDFSRVIREEIYTEKEKIFR